MTAAEAKARAYFERVRAKDAAGVAAQFAPTGVLKLPNGKQLTGRGEIEAYYVSILARATPNPKVISVIVEGNRCLAEIHAHRPDGTPVPVADVFTLDAAGEVTELAIYTTTVG